MNVKHNIIVDTSGRGDVTTIQHALDLAPNDHSPYTILINNGCYQEKLHITRPNTHLVGESKENTVICYTAANGLLANDGKIWATYNSYVVNADAENITFQSLTIENTFDFIGNQQKGSDDTTKVTATQAVALLVGEKGNQIQCVNCSLKSYQDSLYVSAGFSYFESVDIWGTVDFVFGGGTALFNQCQLISRWREDVSDNSPWGYISAPSTLIDQTFGFVFYQCALTKESQKVPDNSYKLGRPWHPTTQFEDGSYANPNAIGHCAYIECEVGSHINGWDKMHGKAKDGTSVFFYAEDSRFYTYKNNYALTCSNQASKFELNAESLRRYSLEQILAGWKPSLMHKAYP